jgi:hypothetical protein
MDWYRRLRLGDRIVRTVDRLTVGVLLVAVIAVVVAFAIIFRKLAQSGGIRPTFANASAAFTWADALYFSVVTISSLGYGDYRPVGTARILAGTEVLFGLLILSLFISKVASDRQSALIKLLYSSDHERRLQAFASDLDAYARRVRSAARDHHDQRLLRIAKASRKLLQGLRSYVVFQTQVGLLGEGNRGVFRKVMRRAADLATFTAQAAKQPGTNARTRRLLEKSLYSAAQLAEAVETLTNDEEVKATCGGIRSLAVDHRRSHATAAKRGGVLTSRAIAEVTPNLLQRVSQQIKSPPWPRDVHVQVAEQQDISRKLALRCVERLSTHASMEESDAVEERSDSARRRQSNTR